MGLYFWTNSMEITGMAAKIRLYLKNEAVKEWTDRLHSIANDDDAFYVHPMKSWLSTSCCTSNASNVTKINHPPHNIDASTAHLQAAVSRWLLHQQVEYPLPDTILDC